MIEDLEGCGRISVRHKLKRVGRKKKAVRAKEDTICSEGKI
jgi:hypothetical protein